MTNPQIVPNHVSFIMDGNGRWAKEKGQNRLFGHAEGVESVREIISASLDLGIKYVSFYAFSEENWNRSLEEVSGLMHLMQKMLKLELNTFLNNGVRFLVIGNKSRLSPELNEVISWFEDSTASMDRMTAVFFISYSGKWDIWQAACRMARDLNNGNADVSGPDNFDRYLSTAGIPDPDLVIRTSGEKRISNYMLWQLAYSEFVFSDTLWPDFRREQYLAALNEYASRDRRFGKVK